MTPVVASIFVVAPRYARDLGVVLDARGIPAEIVQRPAAAAAALVRSAATVAVVDARGAMAAAMLAAHEIAGIVEARRGVMLVLVARGDVGAVAAARAAGATQVLVGPFGADELGEAIGFAKRIAERLSAVGGGEESGDGHLHRDPLTGLATAYHALGWLRGLLGGERDPAAALLLIGVGRFAAINAAHGQPAADALLQAVAERLTRVVGEGDRKDGSGGDQLVARMAGAEFAVVLPWPVAVADGVALARRIVAAFETPFASNARIVHLAVRIGVAVAEGSGDAAGAERLFRHARAALAEARTGTPGAIETFRGPGEGGDPLTRLADLESDLRRAVAEDDFDIVYQPQVALGSPGQGRSGQGRIAGVEALVRWCHPVFGPLSAETLLEAAASAEFATAFGASIRAKALREAAAWPAVLGDLQLSVNVTAGDLREPEFAHILGLAIAASGFPPGRLVLEITESDLIENLDAAAATLADLRARGIGIALDDFGTGYSSLAYLKSLPLDMLKLDKRLTRDLAGQRRDRVVVRVVVALARALGIRVVAEGVETAGDLALVTAARCDWYQGFLCSAPMPGAELADFVEAWQADAVGRVLTD
ncbi:bifunctional diguanylate cyclase/phosphodiesterase [Sphingosinicellaceae bacterium]|nr:bifunctional diguanylate cyclase/phosphodiesterase [Sphingosinicellaceae bacterium]